MARARAPVVAAARASDVERRAARASVTIRPDAALSSRAGSGALARVRGRVVALTAAHVARFAWPRNRVRVVVDGRVRLGWVVGVHDACDLAVVTFEDAAAAAADALETRACETGERVLASGTPMAHAAVCGAFGGVVRRMRGRGEDGVVLGTHEGTYAMHTARVLAGMSGGGLVGADGRLVGVHSFGDAFYGGERDVAVCATRADEIELWEDGCDPALLDATRVHRMIFESGDAALRRLAPELSARERARWIGVGAS